MSANICNVCTHCSRCAGQPPSRNDVDESHKHAILHNPYALSHFLAAGTIHLPLFHSSSYYVCDHVHADDGHHQFCGDVLLPLASQPDGDVLCRQIAFLVQHNFIAATYDLDFPHSAIVRIYLVPYDLKNVHGILRSRPPAILASARKYMRNLLPLLELASQAVPLLPKENDTPSLTEIYHNLPSPDPMHTQTLGMDAFKGMRSRLYNYQRRTVATMIQWEKERIIPDPLYIPITAADGKAFFLQPGTMEVLRDRPCVDANRGGILCEELGTGKTVMILALILATLYQLSSPEDSIIDPRPILTPLSFKHFPSLPFHDARQRFYRGSRSLESPSSVPSLVELLLDRSCLHPSTVHSNEEKLEAIGLHRIRRMNVPFYHCYDVSLPDTSRTSRRPPECAPCVMYLTTATLIVVPSSLIGQWNSEILKHCSHLLRVLTLHPTDSMPQVKSLASDYDIILLTYERFTAEDHFKDCSKLYTWKTCDCPSFERIRVPNCQCPDLPVSPLLQIRWKRLVIDEGHVSATTTTTLTPFVKLLSVECKWIVTGTPTTNLLGLALGQHSVGCSEEEECPSDSEDEELFTTSTPSPQPRTPHVWTKNDRTDLNKLGTMIKHFVGMPLFSSESSLMKTHVIDPLLGANGPRPGAIKVLEQLMETVMIRHRVDDVEEDVVLPRLRHEPVLLDMEPHAVKSYNAIQATIAINALDSRRVDQDYLFHPSNSEVLQQLVKNLSQVMFWSADHQLFNIVDIAASSEKYLRNAKRRNIPYSDRKLLEDALRHVQLAIADDLWKSMQEHEDVPYQVFGMNRNLFTAWTRTLSPEHGPSTLTGYIHPDRLRKLRRVLVKRPLIILEKLIEIGHVVQLHDNEARRRYLEKEELKSKGRKKPGKKIPPVSKTAIAENSQDGQQDKTSAAFHIQEDSPHSKLKLLPIPDFQSLEATNVPPFLANTLHANIRVGASSSSKLNYILNEVVQYSSEEKFLIFSTSPLTLAHIGEGLDLIQVKYLHFMAKDTPRKREQKVVTFETDDKFRVFLLELRHGARGLNLISASRVIFCEPVWQADVESQAIKRVHRIGQTREITVKTLAIRNTSEEFMASRRDALKHSQGKYPKLMEETGMRYFIANPKFIEDKPTFLPTLDVPLFQFCSSQLDANEDKNEINLHSEAGGATSPQTPSHRSPKKLRWSN